MSQWINDLEVAQGSKKIKQNTKKTDLKILIKAQSTEKQKGR